MKYLGCFLHGQVTWSQLRRPSDICIFCLWLHGEQRTSGHKCLSEARAVELAGVLDVVRYEDVPHLRKLPAREQREDCKCRTLLCFLP